MSNDKQPPKQKPFDIRERLFLFACDVIDVAQKLHSRGPIAGSLSLQLVSAAVSAASNAEEADDGSSGKDFRAKQRICLREIKETRHSVFVSFAQRASSMRPQTSCFRSPTNFDSS